MDRNRLIALFLAESRDHLGASHDLLAGMADDSAPPLRELMRHAHSLKGMAMSLGFSALERLAHAMEDLFESLQEDPAAKARDLPPLAAEGLACMGRIVDAVERGDEESCPEAQELAGKLRSACSRNDPSPPAEPGEEHAAPPEAKQELRRFRIEILLYREAAQRAERLVSALRALAGLGRVEHADPPLQAGDSGRFEGRLALTLLTSVSGGALDAELRGMPEVACFNVQELAAETNATEAGDAPLRWVRVRSDLLDAAVDGSLNLLHENRRARADLDAPSGPMVSHLERSGYMLRELYDTLSELRLVPFQDAVQRLSQTVHEVARELAKPVRFRVEGGTIRLDRSVLEILTDPLQHMIRNALDHGIESPAGRRESGKPAEASLTLNVERRGEWIHVSLEDDGRGLDPAALRTAAVERGLISAERASRLSDRDALLLATLPKVSTHAQVTRFSGRGVGLDVVRDGVERLGGRLSIDSRPGRGTRIDLALPLTLALLQALLVRCGERLFALPIARVQSTISWENSPKRSEAREGGPALVHLRDRLDLGRTAAPTSDATALLFEIEGRPAALVVDEVIGRREIVVRPLGPPLNALRHYSGAALLDDGSIVLLLDPDSIVSGQDAAEGRLPRSIHVAE